MSSPTSTPNYKGSIQITRMLDCFVPTFVDNNQKKTYFPQKSSIDQKTAVVSAKALANLNNVLFNEKVIMLDKPIITVSAPLTTSYDKTPFWQVMEIEKSGSLRRSVHYSNKIGDADFLERVYASEESAKAQAKAYADKSGLPYDPLLGVQLEVYRQISEKVEKEKKCEELREKAESKLNNTKFL